jgi:hypothetical protein
MAHCQDGKSGALVLAAGKGDKDMCSVLINDGVNVNSPDQVGPYVVMM